MNSILLSVSDRWIPDARVDAIADFAIRLGRSILAVHVAYGTEASGADPTPGERILEQVAAQLRACQAKVESLFLFSDDIAQAVLKTAAEKKVNMIILGLSTKGMFTRLIEGNVAQEIIKAAPVPVLLLPPDWVNPI